MESGPCRPEEKYKNKRKNRICFLLTIQAPPFCSAWFMAGAEGRYHD